MRCVPLALAVPDDATRAEAAAAGSPITHADPRCAESCVALLTVLDGTDAQRAVDAGPPTAADRGAPQEV